MNRANPRHIRGLIVMTKSILVASRRTAAALGLLFVFVSITPAQAADPLPSWNDGPAKQSIVAFVNKVTDKSGPNYVEPEDRIATFDQDGTLWVEHSLYTQAIFALARVHELAPQHPEWKQREPFKAVLTNDRAA